MNRRFTVVPLLAVVLLSLAACNNSTTGNATPGGSQSTGGSLPTGGGSGGVSTASLQPCDLLSSADASVLQLTEGGPVNEGGARACKWQKSVDINGQNGYGVEIGIRDSQGLNSINSAGYTVTDDNVGKHSGKQAALNIGGSCFVAIGVGSSARVDVVVTAGTNTRQACQFANQLAALVEPRLPGGGS